MSTINYQGTPPFVLVRAFEQAASRGVEHYSTDLRTEVVFTDVTGPKEDVTMRPMEKQGGWVGYALWFKVAKGI